MKSLASEVANLGQTVLVLQGGGALGAYQVGVYEALHEAGIEPDWVIGTSIGAINAALIAGSKPDERLDKLCEFWSRVQNDHLIPGGLPSWMASAARNMLAVTNGVPAFFNPNPMAFLSPHNKLGADAAGYYSVEPLRRTLEELIDFDQLNHGPTRLTVGASRVRTRGDALFRLARHAARAGSRHGVRRASASVPRGAHRRRALLGRRHPFEHAGRSRVRRQSAAQRPGFRSPHLEPAWAGAGDHVGGHEPPEGRAIFEPRRRSYQAAAPAASHAPRDR